MALFLFDLIWSAYIHRRGRFVIIIFLLQIRSQQTKAASEINLRVRFTVEDAFGEDFGNSELHYDDQD